MPELTRKPIDGRVTGPRPRGKGAWFMLLFSLPFLGAGIGIIVLGAYNLQSLKDEDVPPSVVIAFGAMFAAAGLFLSINALAGIFRTGRQKRLLTDRPGEPWFADYPWDSQGTRDANPSEIGKRLLFLLGFCGIISVVQYIFIRMSFGFAGFGTWILLFATPLFLIFDVVAICLIVGWVRKVGQHIRFGRSYLRFLQFPFFLGDPLEVAFALPSALGRCERIKCTLRFVEEVSERDEDDVGGICFYQTYADTQMIDLDRPMGMGEEIPIRFDLPEGEYPNRLNESLRKHWELEIAASETDLKFDARFLLPVYSRSEKQP